MFYESKKYKNIIDKKPKKGLLANQLSFKECLTFI